MPKLPFLYRVRELLRRLGIALGGLKGELGSMESNIEQMQKELDRMHDLFNSVARRDESTMARQLADLSEDNGRLLELIRGNIRRDVEVSRARIDPGNFDMWLKHPIFWLFTVGITEMFLETKAANYLETKMWAEEVGMVVCTVRKEIGKTPDELRRQAEVERDEMKTERDKVNNDNHELRAQVERLKYVISLNDAVVNHAREQSDARLAAEVERDALKTEVERLRQALGNLRITTAVYMRLEDSENEDKAWAALKALTTALNEAGELLTSPDKKADPK